MISQRYESARPTGSHQRLHASEEGPKQHAHRQARRQTGQAEALAPRHDLQSKFRNELATGWNATQPGTSGTRPTHAYNYTMMSLFSLTSAICTRRQTICRIYCKTSLAKPCDYGISYAQLVASTPYACLNRGNHCISRLLASSTVDADHTFYLRAKPASELACACRASRPSERDTAPATFKTLRQSYLSV